MKKINIFTAVIGIACQGTILACPTCMGRATTPTTEFFAEERYSQRIEELDTMYQAMQDDKNVESEANNSQENS